jgi:replicative DNA helicase
VADNKKPPAKKLPPEASLNFHPSDSEAELSVLGGMIVNPIVTNYALSVLTETDFFITTHREVFRAISELTEIREPVDVVSVGDRLTRSYAAKGFSLAGLLKEYRGNSERHVLLVKQLSKRRQVISLIEEVRPRLTGVENVDDIIGELTTALIGITTDKTNEPVTIGKATVQALAKIEQASSGGGIGGIRTGIEGFDNVTGGGFPGEVMVIAARPGIGKTAMALTLAVNWGRQNISSLLVNAEMPVWQLAVRMLARESGIANFDLRRGRLEERDIPIVTAGATRLSALPILLYDDNHWGRIKAQIRAAKLRDKTLQVVMIDYAQRIKVDVAQEKRYLDLAKISNEAKDMARGLEVLVVILSQVNRGLDKGDKAPELSDLRESGDLEADADIVTFLHPGKMQAGRQLGEVGVRVDWLIKKNRGGPDGNVALRYLGDSVMFEDWKEESSDGIGPIFGGRDFTGGD